MPTTYTNGLKLPDLGSIDWFNAYKNNIDILDPIVGTVNGVATTYAPISHNHSASEITSGTIDIARLPPAALERLHIVADQTARYALTTSTVQEGDTVKQTDTGVMYLVVDSTKLNSADGYTEYSAGTASKAIADEDGTSIKTGYVNVAGNQTVTGDKSFTGSNTFNNILPNATNTYALGSSSYQWSAVYAQAYYYNGTQWGLDQGNTWTEANIFYKSIQIHGGRNAYIMPEFGASYSGLAFGTVEFKQSFKFGDWVDNNSKIGLNTSNAYVEIYAGLDSSDNNNKVRLNPSPNATTAELGTATAKWKTLNGVNPGALSLPKGYTEEGADKDYVDISSVIQTLDDTIYFYTLPDNGWIVIRADMATHVQVSIAGGWVFGQSIYHSTGGTLIASVPFRKGETVALKVLGSILQTARFYPCAGNV